MAGFLNSSLTRRIALVLVFTMTILGVTPRVDAGFIASSDLLDPMTRAQDLGSVQKLLERKIVTERLKAFGYDRQEIMDRLAQLSDQELHQVATQVNTLTVAGDGIGLVISLLVIIALVLVILRLADRQIVIK